jgi:imidazolonepropionase-like amidohydrolase
MRTFVALIALCTVAPAIDAQEYDLAIRHARVLDVRTGTTRSDQDVLISGGIIRAVRASAPGPVRARRTIEARGRLLTPGLIDVHLHLDTDGIPLDTSPASIAGYRAKLGAAYLPFGVTTVRDAGTDERAMPLLRALMVSSSTAPDFHPVGAHLISSQGNRPHVAWQVVVEDSAAAAAKVRSYFEQGLRDIKLYWRLREPEFRGALIEGERLGMTVTGHVDLGVMTIDRALDLGLRHFEHVHPMGYSVLTDADFDSLMAQAPRTLGVTPPRFPPTAMFMNVPEIFNYLGAENARILAILARLKATNSSLTPTLHVFAQRYGLTYFQSAPRDSTEDTSVWTAQQRERTRAGYRVMASYVKRMHDLGVRLAIGTDAQDPGRAVLSEMLLLHDAGISMADVFRIATLDSAFAIGREAELGSIEAGKRAHLVLFAGDPLSRPMDLLSPKLVIKSGVVVAGAAELQ